MINSTNSDGDAVSAARTAKSCLSASFARSNSADSITSEPSSKKHEPKKYGQLLKLEDRSLPGGGDRERGLFD